MNELEQRLALLENKLARQKRYITALALGVALLVLTFLVIFATLAQEKTAMPWDIPDGRKTWVPPGAKVKPLIAKAIVAEQLEAESISAERLTIRDAEDKTRAILDVDSLGPGLWLYDEKGVPRAGLDVDSLGSKLRLFDEKGKPRAGLAVSSEVTGLGLYDENGVPRASLRVGNRGPSIDLWGSDGNHRLALRRTELERVKTGQGIIRPESSIVLFDKEGKVIWKAPPD